MTGQKSPPGGLWEKITNNKGPSSDKYSPEDAADQEDREKPLANPEPPCPVPDQPPERACAA